MINLTIFLKAKLVFLSLNIHPLYKRPNKALDIGAAPLQLLYFVITVSLLAHNTSNVGSFCCMQQNHLCT